MRVLWICNIMLPVIADSLQIPYSNKEGWLTGLSEKLLQNKGNDIVLGIAFPCNPEITNRGKVENQELYYYGFSEDTVHEEAYDENLEPAIREIVEDFKPDIIHVFGTEFGHSLAAVKAFDKPEKTLVGLQGICYKCAENYLLGIPEKVASRSLFRDFVKQDNLMSQKRKMEARGDREKQTLLLTGNVTGRTEFDKEAVLSVNGGLKYFKMNETMRAVFYDGTWDIDKCEKHRIFASQGNYTIKGLHLLLRAMAILKETYPDIKLFVAGDDIVRGNSLMDKIKIASYAQYLKDLISEGGLKENVYFTGPLSAAQMKEQLLLAQVFVSPSLIENSPNSVCEAQLLGVPVVASEVGGVPDLITDGVTGLMYSVENVSALSAAIGRVFEDPKLALKLSQNSVDVARVRHDGDENYNRLLEIYRELMK